MESGSSHDPSCEVNEGKCFCPWPGYRTTRAGILLAVVTLSIQSWSITTSGSHWQTMVFTVLCLTQLGHVLAIRSE
ncbi:MAG TPA: hypothetical protein PKM17_09495, partial [Syntrophorhabdus sp.]|nr:hypothetical protein [Syntrophorhabdus sp.]